MRSIVFGVLLMGVVVSSCKKEEKPSCLLSEDQMADILVQLNIDRKEIELRHLAPDSADAYFFQVFKPKALSERNVSVVCFDSSYIYYTQHLDKMTDIYSHVVDSLSLLEIVVENEKKAFMIKERNRR